MNFVNSTKLISLRKEVGVIDSKEDDETINKLKT